LKAVHFKWLQQQDTPDQAQTGLLTAGGFRPFRRLFLFLNRFVRGVSPPSGAAALAAGSACQRLSDLDNNVVWAELALES
jgi:hypothetical protein